VTCGDDGCQTEGPENRECFPIFVPPNDPVFGGQRDCLMFVRSQEVPNDLCRPGFVYRFVTERLLIESDRTKAIQSETRSFFLRPSDLLHAV